MSSLVDTAQQPRFDRGYTGHEHIASLGLINMNGRLYDPHLQRFLSPDPYVQQPGNSQSYNRYSYCLNNPLRYTDPSGYNPVAMGVGVFVGMMVLADSYMYIRGRMNDESHKEAWNNTFIGSFCRLFKNNRNDVTGTGSISNIDNGPNPNAGKTIMPNGSHYLGQSLNPIDQIGPNDCLFATVASIYQLYGINASQEDIRAAYPDAYGRKYGAEWGQMFQSKILKETEGVKNYSIFTLGEGQKDNVMKKMCSSLDLNHPVLIQSKNDAGGKHALVVYGVENYTDGSSSVFYYDPNPLLTSNYQVMNYADFYTHFLNAFSITKCKYKL